MHGRLLLYNLIIHIYIYIHTPNSILLFETLTLKMSSFWNKKILGLGQRGTILYFMIFGCKMA